MRYLVIVGVTLLVGCGGRSPQLLTPNPPNSIAATTLAFPLSATENVRARDVRSGENSSIAVIQIRDREPPHIHTRYDLAVTLIRGSGTLWLDGAPLAMHENDVAFIPKGTPHYFINDGKQPAAALVVFAPPFTGPDQQPVP